MVACLEAFTASNTAAGWRATGIFLRNRSKALNSRLVRQNLCDQPDSSLWRTPEAPGLAIISGIDISTPKSSRQINIIAKDLRSMDPTLLQRTRGDGGGGWRPLTVFRWPVPHSLARIPQVGGLTNLVPGDAVSATRLSGVTSVLSFTALVACKREPDSFGRPRIRAGDCGWCWAG